MDKTELQKALSQMESLEGQREELEQYQTPPGIAADVLHRMDLNGELDGKVVDLGCGNGVFTIGAALMGAAALGIDVDEEAVEKARENLERVRSLIPEGGEARFLSGDVRDTDFQAGSVVTNPPFGMQKEDMNRAFLQAGFEAAPVVYALLHQSPDKKGETREFLARFAGERGFEAAVLEMYDFPLPRTLDHHLKEKKYIKVDLYRFEQV